jgi:bacteriocin-like protein
MAESIGKGEDLAQAMEGIEVTELDDKDLEQVVGGSNGNCSCPPGSTATGSYDNGNCSCSGGTEIENQT